MRSLPRLACFASQQSAPPPGREFALASRTKEQRCAIYAPRTQRTSRALEAHIVSVASAPPQRERGWELESDATYYDLAVRYLPPKYVPLATGSDAPLASSDLQHVIIARRQR